MRIGWDGGGGHTSLASIRAEARRAADDGFASYWLSQITGPDALTALAANPHALRSLQELVGPEQVLFGSDHPFAPEPVSRASIEGLAPYDGFDAPARAKIERDNALALLPRLAARLGASA